MRLPPHQGSGHPIQFCLIVDDFGVEYVGMEHFDYLRNLLQKYHGVQFNMAGDKPNWRRLISHNKPETLLFYLVRLALL